MDFNSIYILCSWPQHANAIVKVLKKKLSPGIPNSTKALGFRTMVGEKKKIILRKSKKAKPNTAANGGARMLEFSVRTVNYRERLLCFYTE